ncbi:cupin domain-containing protein [Gulosibacter chungangensis]|uniref:Cupin n=1 Tax=Gulosibacter chungangensis TaxID=979746 RepID=A0A7J5B8V9_9MICO|nr:cupin domain-containing protein [Gulosibacter chungangensis]KAB1640703.1 cupin [Gulosibacter chungangensis]
MSIDPEPHSVPRVIGHTDALSNASAEARGAVWKLQEVDRDLDSNLIRLPAGESIGDFDGPELDSLVIVLMGSGTLRTAEGEIPLEPGQILWLPKRSRRGYLAGPNGLGYLTVHQRRLTEPLMPRIRPGAESSPV